jgi:hypothetical protein
VSSPAASTNSSVPISSSGEAIVVRLSHHTLDAIVVDVSGVMGENTDFSHSRGFLPPCWALMAAAARLGRAGCSCVVLRGDASVLRRVKKGEVR